MIPVRSPLGAIGVILVALEAIFGSIVLFSDASPGLRAAMAAAMIAVLAVVTLVVLWMVVYLTLKNPGFLFNPAEVAKLSESVQRGIYAIPVDDIVITDETVDLTEAGADPPIAGETDESPDTDSIDADDSPADGR